MDNAKSNERILNPEQKQAVEFGEGPLLIIAGAGTGKTTVVTERIKHLFFSGRAKPTEILALTFTEKASREMEERIDLILPYGVTNMWISTFHSFCDRVLRADGLAIGLDPNYKLMTEAETIQFLKTHLFAFNLQYFRPLGNPNKFISGMIQHFSRLKDEDVSPNQYLEWLKSKKQKAKSVDDEKMEELDKLQELANAYKTYEELKVREGKADYSDLISNCLELFRKRPAILSSYQEQFKYLLIDEFQDTNVAQNELAILLAGSRKNITVVGDDDQAIYRFRGAAVSNMIQFRSRFPKTEIVVLTKNYRSTLEILDRSYDLIQHNNPDRLEVVEKIDKKLECMRRINGEPIKFLYQERVEDEAEEVASIIQNSEFRIQNNYKERYKWKDFAILVRANAHVEPFVRAFARHGIPYQFLGPGQLFKQPEVKDLIAYLKILYDVTDNVAMYRVLSMDHFGIPARDVALIISYARQRGKSLFEMCESLAVPDRALIGNENFDASSVANASSPSTVPFKASEAAQNFITSRRENTIILSIEGKNKIDNLFKLILRHLELLKKETAGQILYYFLEESGLLQTFTFFKTEKEEKIANNIAKFFDKLKTYEVDHEDASVFTVVDWLMLSMDLGESPLAANTDWSSYNAVNILTVHSAKGLEFPVVFLVNLVSGRFPSMERREQIPIPDELIKEVLPQGDFHEEEERRLFYVGMTRARDHLFLTGASYYGEAKREKKLSLFITEAIGKEAINITQKPVEKTAQLTLLEWAKPGAMENGKKEYEKTQINYVSYSQLETYKTCPLQYKYRYILKIPVPPSAALTFGDSVHRAMRAFYELVMKKETVTKDTLLSLLETHWQGIGYKNKEYEAKMKAHGKELLSEYFDKGFNPTVNVIALEQPFRMKITPTLTAGGKIDRVDRKPDGIIEIIDYKTGSAPKKRDVTEDKQLSVYALAATEKGLYNADPKQVIVTFYFFEGQEAVSGTRTKEQLESTKTDIIETTKGIETSDFHANPGKQCDFCEFRLICEAWK